MVNLGNFNPNEHESRGSFDPLPSGWYAMQITESEMKFTKDSTGQYLQLTLEIIEAQHPEHKGRLVWDRLNLVNNNQTAVDIANGTLSSICKAVGHLGELSDSDVLHHKPLAVKLKFVPEKGEYDAKNDVKGYDSCVARASAFGSAPAAVTQPIAQAKPAQQAAANPAQPAGKPSWMNQG